MPEKKKKDTKMLTIVISSKWSLIDFNFSFSFICGFQLSIVNVYLIISH